VGRRFQIGDCLGDGLQATAQRTRGLKFAVEPSNLRSHHGNMLGRQDARRRIDSPRIAPGPVTVVVPGQKSEDDEGVAIPASGIAGIEPTITEASSQPPAQESEAKATADLSLQTGTAEAQIEVAEPAATVVEVKQPSTDVNAPPTTVRGKSLFASMRAIRRV
jgi:hypothetical protein